MSLVPTPKNCDRSVSKAIQYLCKRLGHVSYLNFTASRLVATDSDKKLSSVSDLTSWVAGTANQVIVTDDGDGTITLSLPQDIATTSQPTFDQVTLSSTPSNNTDGATKAYADSLLTGAFWNNVAVGTIANVDLSTDLEAGDTIDDYVLQEGDRVLVKEQTDQTQNGLYVVPASGAASRATDADEDAEIINKKCIVQNNGSLTGRRFYFVANSTVTIGTTDIEILEVTLMSDHNTLSGLQGGQAGPPTEYYHLTASQHTELTAIAALGTAADKFLYTTGADTWAEGAITTAGRAILDDADASAQRTTLGLAIGTDVQAYDSELAALAGLTSAADKLPYFTGSGTASLCDLTSYGRSLIAVANEAALKSLVNLEIGTDVLAQQTIGIADDNLVEIDDADAADNDYAKFTANGLEGRSYAEVKTDLSLDSVENTALSTWAGSANITTLGTIGTGVWQGTSIGVTYTDAKCTDATADNTSSNETSHADVVVDSDFGSAGVCKTDGAGTYSIGTIGIADNNILEIDDADAADNDYCKLTANGIEGRSAAEVLSDLSGQASGAFALNSQNLTGVAALVIDDTGTIGSASDTDIMTLAADGTCTFSVFPVTPSAAPDADYEVANKKYVDDNAGGGGGASEIVFKAKDRVGPATSYATFDKVSGGSTPAEEILVLDFDASSSEYVDFRDNLFSGYSNGGLTLKIKYSMTSDHDESTPHKVRWEAAIRRVNDDAEDINGSHSYQFNGVSDIVPSEVGEISYATITFTDGADMDSLDAEEEFILRIYRDHDHADDNATGDAEFWSVTITET